MPNDNQSYHPGHDTLLHLVKVGIKSDFPCIPPKPTSTVMRSDLWPSSLSTSTRSWYFALFPTLASATYDSLSAQRATVPTAGHSTEWCPVSDWLVWCTGGSCTPLGSVNGDRKQRRQYVFLDLWHKGQSHMWRLALVERVLSGAYLAQTSVSLVVSLYTLLPLPINSSSELFSQDLAFLPGQEAGWADVSH